MKLWIFQSKQLLTVIIVQVYVLVVMQIQIIVLPVVVS